MFPLKNVFLLKFCHFVKIKIKNVVLFKNNRARTLQLLQNSSAILNMELIIKTSKIASKKLYYLK